MSDNAFNRVDEGLADLRRVLQRIHEDIQVIKHDFEEFRNLGQDRTISRTFKPTSYDSSLKNGEPYDESTGGK